MIGAEFSGILCNSINLASYGVALNENLTHLLQFLTVCYTINNFGTLSFTIVASGMFLSATTRVTATFLVALKIVRVTR